MAGRCHVRGKYTICVLQILHSDRTSIGYTNILTSSLRLYGPLLCLQRVIVLCRWANYYMPPLSLLPLPHSLSFPQPTISALARPVLTKIKVEPVNLEPLLPRVKRDNAVQVAHNHTNLQLPTPPLGQTLDPCHTPDTSFFGNVHLQPRQEGEEEERGRTREPKPRRFHTHERTRPRMTPYDSECRPRGGICQKNAQTTTDTSPYTRKKTNLTDIAAAAAAVVVLDRTTPSQSFGLPLQRDRLGSVPTPPHHHHHHRHDHIHQQQPTHDTHHLHFKGTDDASQAIDDAVDGMIKLYSCESQPHQTTPSRSESEAQAPLSSERQQCRQFYTDLQKERGVLALLKFQIQRDKCRLQRERQKLRGQVEQEIFAEKQALKARIERLEAMVFCRQ